MKNLIIAVVAVLSLSTLAAAMPSETKCVVTGIDKAGKLYTAEGKYKQDVSHFAEATIESFVLSAAEELKGQGFDPATGQSVTIVCTNPAGEGYRIEAGEKVKTRSCLQD
jgi:hypothetical protein